MSAPTAQMADAGLKAVMGLSNLFLQEANADAANVINEANAWSSNLIRSANNELRGARSSLARYNQSVNNQRTLDNVGAAQAAHITNYRRARDSATQDDFETQIRMAEGAGAQAAAAALSGLTGGVADLVAGTSALRSERIKQRSLEASKQQAWDAAQVQRNIALAGYDQLDYSEIATDLDYGIDVAQKQRSTGSLLSAVLGGQDMKGLSNIADYAGPKAKSFFNNAFKGSENV